MAASNELKDIFEHWEREQRRRRAKGSRQPLDKLTDLYLVQFYLLILDYYAVSEIIRAYTKMA